MRLWIGLLLFLFSLPALAQPCKSIRNTQTKLTAKCIKIRSILVDACGNPEGENEILLFETGKNAVSLSSISVKWANASNRWLGLTQSSATSALVSNINATIVGCGKLLEPSGTSIPANKKVYLFTSTDFTVGSNQFTNLSDTAYAIFQKAGNTAGHFANYSAPSGLRTTVLYVAGFCSDTATYDKVKLVKQNGTVGSEDGGYVNFDSTGKATYLNDGCNAPSEPLKVTAVSLNGNSFCPGDSVLLQGTVSGGLCFVWRAATGRFSDTTSLFPVYYPDYSKPSSPELWLYNCNGGVKASVSINIKNQQPVFAGNDTIVCAGNAILLKMRSGAGPVVWKMMGGKGNIQNPNSSVTTYVPDLNDTTVYFVLQAFNGCNAASDTLKAMWIQKIKPDFQLSDSIVCQNADSVFFYPLNKGGVFSGLTMSLTPAYQPSVPGRYRIVYRTQNNGCRDSAVKYLLVHPMPNPMFEMTPNDTVKMGESVTMQPKQIGKYRHDWSLGGNTFSLPYKTIRDGQFRILHRITDTMTGCTDTFSLLLTVLGEEDIWLANVFTPDGDGKNDIFNLRGNGILKSQLKIFNRWGELLFESDDLAIGWNGKTAQSTLCPEGTYFWQMTYSLRSGKSGSHSGSVNLIR